MQNERIYLDRIDRFMNSMYEKRYTHSSPMNAEFIYDAKDPITFEKAIKATYKPILKGEKWGDLWGSGWFKFTAKVPLEWKSATVGAIIDTNSEGCVFNSDGVPVQGLTNKNAWDLLTRKRLVKLYNPAKGGEDVSILVETGANHIMGSWGDKSFNLEVCDLVCINQKIFTLYYDMLTLKRLAEALVENSPRRNKLIYGLNKIANVWNDGVGIDSCIKISKDLVTSPANASSLNMYSIGHAHIDLGWLWRTRETIRKGCRTFSSALKYMEEYPSYKFGASQPQLYEWVKDNYPELFKKIQKAVVDKKWECQGAMWVEPDMNIVSGESLVRQCLYGKNFFKNEFGVDVKNLWLPDVFGYSAALPQILKKCGVDYFMTQKISWNETNVFPHHTFMWEGIDGTRLLTHFLPTNNYNFSNLPNDSIAAEKRYAQSYMSNEFLNLFGIGDGGGGPSRAHIEIGDRQLSCEGAPKFKPAFASEFFDTISKVPQNEWPVWCGELYLELHRGTYTTQALMKKYNRKIELALRDVELLSSVAFDSTEYPKSELDQIWKNTLLNQFHDILPGSSIKDVYDDAHEMSAANVHKLHKLEQTALTKLFGNKSENPNVFVILNTLSWDRTEIVYLPVKKSDSVAYDTNNNEIPCDYRNGFLECQVTIPSMGYTTVIIKTGTRKIVEAALEATPEMIENDCVKVLIDKSGKFTSIFDKEASREVLVASANNLQLWEDLPNNWEAWDINHFYRETSPTKMEDVTVAVEWMTSLSACVKVSGTIGVSKVEQQIILSKGSKLVTIKNKVDWKERKKMLRVDAQVAVHANDASFEIQYGTVRRPNHSNTSWEQSKFEVAGHRFADLSQPDYGVALINDCKYGYYVKENHLDLALLRSPDSPDGNPVDQREHEFTFAYYPHKNDLISSDSLRVSHNVNEPIKIWGVDNIPFLPIKSNFGINGGSVKIEAVKRAEDGKGIVVRLYETNGAGCKVTFTKNGGWTELAETTMLEAIVSSIAQKGNSIELTFKPFEIRTFLIK